MADRHRPVRRAGEAAAWAIAIVGTLALYGPVRSDEARREETGSGGVSVHPAERAGPQALEPLVESVLALWRDADVVALGEDHGRQLDSDLRIALVRHPGFGPTVDVIVVEFANAHWQGVLDRYVAGESVPRAELVRVWRDTGYETWDSPIYEAFLTAVREANAGQPAEHQVRVIAGDLPIAWDTVASGRELLQFSDRGDYPTHIVDCEILAKGLKGLLVYGALHLVHGPGDSFVTSLDRKYPGRVRTLIGSAVSEESTRRLRTELNLGPDPQLVLGSGTSIERWSFYQTIGFGLERSDLTLGQAVDGILYYGGVADRVVPRDPTALNDPEYRAQRGRRDALRREFADIVSREGWSGVRQYDDYTCD